MICQIVSSYLKMWQYFREVILVLNTHTHWINIYEWIHIRYDDGICILPTDYWSWKYLALLCMKSISVRPQDVPPCTCISNISDCKVNTIHPSFSSGAATRMQADKHKNMSLYYTSTQVHSTSWRCLKEMCIFKLFHLSYFITYETTNQ